MNDTFSFKRFGLLLRKYFIEEYKQYLILAAGIFSILFLFNGLSVFSNLHGQYDSKMPEMTFLCGFVFGGAIFASLTYSFFQTPAKGIRFIQLPASQLEKIAVMFFLTQVFFAAAFLLLFYSCNWLMSSIYNTFKTIPANIPPQRLKYFVAPLYDITSPTAKQTIVAFLVLSAIAHFCSLLFQKLAFIKTALTFTFFTALVLFINYNYITNAIPENSMPGGFIYNQSIRLISNDSTRGFVILPDNWKTALNWILPGSLYISFWFAGYWKLKEKQL